MLSQAFQRFDADGNGVLDCEEYAAMISALEAKWPDSDLVTEAACSSKRVMLKLLSSGTRILFAK